MEEMNLMEKVIAIGMSLIMIGVLIPVGLQLIANANMTGVDEAVATVFTVLVPILAVVAIIMHFVRR